MSQKLKFFDNSGSLVANLPVGGPFPAAVVRFVVETAFPELIGDESLRIAIRGTDMDYPESPSEVVDATIHTSRSLGQLAAIDPRALRTAPTTPTSIADSASAGSPQFPTADDAAESLVTSVTETIRSGGGALRMDRRAHRLTRTTRPFFTQPGNSGCPGSPSSGSSIRSGLQGQLRALISVRDQRCVVTGIPLPESLETAHILKAEYARSFFQGCSADLLAGQPGAGDRYDKYMDVRNAIYLDRGLHASFDEYRFSIFPVAEDCYRIYTFDDALENRHGSSVLLPVIVPEGYPSRRYFFNRFPAPATFREHFKCAVLMNMKGEGSHARQWDDDEDIAPFSLPASWSTETIADLAPDMSGAKANAHVAEKHPQEMT